MHDHCTAPDPDPVRARLFDAAEALAIALGEPDPTRRAAHLADLARLTAAAQAANAALIPQRPSGSTGSASADQTAVADQP